jgi:hypothetical protein
MRLRLASVLVMLAVPALVQNVQVTTENVLRKGAFTEAIFSVRNNGDKAIGTVHVKCTYFGRGALAIPLPRSLGLGASCRIVAQVAMRDAVRGFFT